MDDLNVVLAGADAWPTREAAEVKAAEHNAATEADPFTSWTVMPSEGGFAVVSVSVGADAMEEPSTASVGGMWRLRDGDA